MNDTSIPWAAAGRLGALNLEPGSGDTDAFRSCLGGGLPCLRAFAAPR